MQKTKANLIEVPETMLWTLHNRANEAMRPNGIIQDDKCVEIYQSINYNYRRSFGPAEPSHASRSITFDHAVRQFLKKYPNGTIVNLGEGLETQRFRVPTEKVLWLTVDLSEAIEIRERYIQPDEWHLHCPYSALDRQWFDLVPKDQPVFVAAQGLFMYFKEQEVIGLVRDICHTFDAGQIMFDTIPRWLSKRTMSVLGWRKTPFYKTPKMP
ncbi:MAG: class I SAM-dependent methyltransferase [Bacteroidota bacterium]